MEKKILKAGSGINLPNKSATVTVDVEGTWCGADGASAVFDQRSDALVELDETDDELSVAVGDMIQTMRGGEQSQFLLHEGQHLLPHSLLTSDPEPRPQKRIQFTIHLRSFRQGKDVWRLTEQERLEIAGRHKQRGSELFKSSHTCGASIRYSKALQYLSPIDPDIPLEVDVLEEHECAILSLRSVCLLNLAACQLRFDQFDHVVRNCSKALEADPRSLKALYRRARALLAMKDFEGARADLVRAREMEPANQAVNELLRSVETKEQTHTAKYREALKTMFKS